MVRARLRREASAGMIQLARSGQPASGRAVRTGTVARIALEQHVIGVEFRVPRTPRFRSIPRNVGFEFGLPSRMSGFLLPAALALQFAAVACNPEDGVALSGTVEDPSGARIPHALVLITNATAEMTEVTVGGEDGSFRIAGLAPSPAYQLEVRGPAGFETHVQGLNLTADQYLNLELGIIGIDEAIVIRSARPSPKSKSPNVPRRRIRIGGNVQRARLLNYVAPVYPSKAERDGVSGTVLLEATIGTDGKLIGLTTLNSSVDQRLEAATTEAVMQWRYDPTLLNGRPVEVVAKISVSFALE